VLDAGKQFTVAGIAVLRFARGKIVEDWLNWDAWVKSNNSVPPRPGVHDFGSRWRWFSQQT